MNILRITILALISIFLIPLDASAHCGGKHSGDHPHCQGDGGGGSGGSGVVAPVEILEVDAISNAITLHWITPITPEGGSEVAYYEIRYSETPLDESNFESGTLFERDAGVSVPALDPGQSELSTIRGLDVDTAYNIGVRAVDADGNVSALDPGSFVTVTTQNPASPSPVWQVETVKQDFSPDNCCSTTSAQFDSAGNPTVAWVQHHGGPKTSGRIWYGYQDGSGGWDTEEVFVAGDCQICYQRPIHDFRTIPVGLPGAETPSNPAILFTHSVSLKGNNKWAEVVVYAYRDDTGAWVTEDIVQGGRWSAVDITGHSAEFSMDFFYVDNVWIPTAAYITTFQREVVLAERTEMGQPAAWSMTPVLQCPEVDSTSPRMRDVRLRRGADGSLHAMVQMDNDFGTWSLIMHRKSDDGTWEYQRTAWIETADFAVDSEGKYYVAGETSEALYGQEMLVLMEQFEPVLAEQMCDAPASDARATYEVADRIGQNDFFNYIPEGAFADISRGSTFGLYLTGDDGQSPPDVHIFQSSHFGRDESHATETRVLSRCASGMWIRDAADRIHQDYGIDSRNFAVSESEIAWAYNYGRPDAPYGWNNDPPDTETMFLARRTGNACQFAN
jgi:hypothetical protein